MILINPDIDSAYWQEWKLINPYKKNGIKGFLIIHFPLLFFILLGLVLVYDHKISGMIISLILSACGLFAFFFHFYHLRKDKPEFKNFYSKTVYSIKLTFDTLSNTEINTPSAINAQQAIEIIESTR